MTARVILPLRALLFVLLGRSVSCMAGTGTLLWGCHLCSIICHYPGNGWRIQKRIHLNVLGGRPKYGLKYEKTQLLTKPAPFPVSQTNFP